MISASKPQESVVFFMYKAQNTRILSYFSTVFAIMVKSLRTGALPAFGDALAVPALVPLEEYLAAVIA